MQLIAAAGAALSVNWSPAASVFPSGQRTQAVSIKLIPPGTKYLERRNQLDIGVRGPHAFRRFFLERVQDIDRLAKADRIDRPECIAVEILDDFKNARPLPLPWFRPWMLAAELSDSERVADLAFDRSREGEQVPPGRWELACHPGLDESLDSVYGAERAVEVETLCDRRVRAAILAAGIELVSFRELSSLSLP